ncbi:MAG: preprotein translocase subunit YajC [Proteobacteria bacterium]|nr:preprotein translocase subunit YajC [Pseudomonadota bacterium]
MAPQGGQGAQGGGLSFLFMIVPLILIFYFLLFRPQKKRADEQKALLSSLKKGDMVMTQGGIHGRITGLTESTVTLEIAEKVRVKVSRPHIAGRLRSDMRS